MIHENNIVSTVIDEVLYVLDWIMNVINCTSILIRLKFLLVYPSLSILLWIPISRWFTTSVLASGSNRLSSLKPAVILLFLWKLIPFFMVQIKETSLPYVQVCPKVSNNLTFTTVDSRGCPPVHHRSKILS